MLEMLSPVMEIIATGTATDLGRLAQGRGYPIRDDELESITRSALVLVEI